LKIPFFDLIFATVSTEKLKTTCSICGIDFECGANTHDCWCNAVPNIMPVEGSSCWCPKCLEQKVAEQNERLIRPKKQAK
jgi:hypothetical protein